MIAPGGAALAVPLSVSFCDELAGLSFEQEMQMKEAIANSKIKIRLSFIRCFCSRFVLYFKEEARDWQIKVRRNCNTGPLRRRNRSCTIYEGLDQNECL